jgi:dTDP-4-dehydrorhamnose reductase
MPEPRYLIIGGSGKLGRALREKIQGDAPSHTQLDILNQDHLNQYLVSGRYDVVIHLAALSNQKYAEAHKEESYQLNVIGTRQVAEAAARHHVKVVYTSTDYVFDGVKGDYCENDLPSPPNWYGFTKYAGELEVRQVRARHCIIRTSFRPADWGFPTAYNNVYTTADYTDVIAAEIAQALTMNLEGVIHIGTPVKTFFELASRRNPAITPEECADPAFPKRRNLNIDRWLALRKGALCES